jgi:hypothetical protein
MRRAEADATLQEDALSRAIEPDWDREVNDRATEPWSLMMVPSRRILAVQMPPIEGRPNQLFAMNTIKRTWSRATGWDTRSVLSTGALFFGGTSDGRILNLDTGTSDIGQPFTATYVSLFDGIQNAAVGMRAAIVRCDVTATRNVQPQLSVMTDFTIDLPTPPSAAPDPTASSIWDDANTQWDTNDLWDGPRERVGFTYRESVAAYGRTMAVAVQITIGGGTIPNVELAGCYVQLEDAEMTA